MLHCAPPRHICIPSGDATPLLLLRLLAFKRNETESFWFLLLSGVESSSSDLVPVTTVTIHVGDVLHCSESRVYRGEGACLKHLWSSPLSEYFTCSSDPYWTSLKCLMRTQHFLLRWDGAGEHKFGRVMGLPSWRSQWLRGYWLGQALCPATPVIRATINTLAPEHVIQFILDPNLLLVFVRGHGKWKQCQCISEMK